MSFTVFLGNLPTWVTADDIKAWLSADGLVADNVKVIRNPETQESKGFAFIDAPNSEEMQSIIRRFDRAPLEDRLLRANPAQPPKGKSERVGGGGGRPGYQSEGRPSGGYTAPPAGASAPAGGGPAAGATGGAAPQGDRPPRPRRDAKDARPPRTGGNGGGKKPSGPPSAFAEELAKAL